MLILWVGRVGGWREENRGFCVQESHINSGTTLLPLKSWLIFEHKFRSSIFNDFELGLGELILGISESILDL